MADPTPLDTAFPPRLDAAFPPVTPKPAPEWPNLRTVGPGEKPMQFPTPLEYIGGNLKRNAPSIAGQAAMGLVPGTGALPTLARVAGPAVAGALAAAGTGQEPGKAAFEQGAAGLGGVALGGLAKSGMRALGAAFDKTEQGIGKLIAKAVPEFAGDTPQQTIKRVMSGEGPAALQQAYKKGLEQVIKDAGDPVVMLPSLGKLYPQQNMAAWRAADAMTLIDSLNRSLKTASGGTSRRKMAQVELDTLTKAEQELTAQLQQHLPPEAQRKLKELDAKYFTGKAIQRWFGAGKEQLTDARVGKLIQKGTVNVPELQKAYLQREGELGKALPPEHAEALKRILRRGEVNPLAMDQPGKSPHVGFFGMRPHPTSLPHAPVRVGEPEITAEDAARIARLLGQRAVQGVASDNPVR